MDQAAQPAQRQLANVGDDIASSVSQVNKRDDCIRQIVWKMIQFGIPLQEGPVATRACRPTSVCISCQLAICAASSWRVACVWLIVPTTVQHASAVADMSCYAAVQVKRNFAGVKGETDGSGGDPEKVSHALINACVDAKLIWETMLTVLLQHATCDAVHHRLQRY